MLPIDNSNWTTPEDCQFLQSLVQQLREDAILVEAGTWTGVSTTCIYEAMRGSQHLFTVDSYPHGFGDFSRGVVSSKGRMRFYFHLVQNKMYPKVTPLYANSADVGWMFPKKSVGFLFLDAGHEYESVREDAVAWWPALESGAVVALDDYPMPGVRKAFDELMREKLLVEPSYGGWHGDKIAVGRKVSVGAPGD